LGILTNVVKLFLEIRKYAPEFESEGLEKEHLWKTMFPEKDYNYGIMKNLIFELSNNVKKFIELENYSAKKFSSHLNIIEQYQARRLISLMEKQICQTKIELQKIEYNQANSYSRFMIDLKYQECLKMKHDAKTLLEYDTLAVNENLTLFFLSTFFKVNYYNFRISHLYNNSPDRHFIKNVLEFFEKAGFENPYTELMYYCFLTVYDPEDQKHYQKARELYFENYHTFSAEDSLNFASSLIDYCKTMIDKGYLSFIKERHVFEKQLIDDNLIIKFGNGFIDKHLFLNIARGATEAGEHNWCIDFIEHYKFMLEENVREHYANFAYAHLYFRSRQFEKAMTHLSKCVNLNVLDKKFVRGYQFFLYYELNYYEEMKHLADTSRHFIKNDKALSAIQREEFLKFINSVMKLSAYRYLRSAGDDNAFRLNEIKQYIASNNMYGINWLKEKIAELETVN